MGYWETTEKHPGKDELVRVEFIRKEENGLTYARKHFKNGAVIIDQHYVGCLSCALGVTPRPFVICDYCKEEMEGKTWICEGHGKHICEECFNKREKKR